MAAEPAFNTESAALIAASVQRLSATDLGWDTRFNYMDRQNGPVTDRSLQYRLRARIRFDLSQSLGTWFAVRLETGKGFDNSWNNTGAGLGSGALVFNVKSVSLHQKIGKYVEAAVGGLDFYRGAGTDATYASGDGHMTGYRLVFQGDSGAPTRISLTAAWVGDFDKPNFFSRARMSRVNYVQLLGERRFGEQFHGSAELDSIRGVGFGRAAVRYGRLWLFDDATIETAVRATDGFRFAWASSVASRWSQNSQWRSALIYSDLPYAFYLVKGTRVLWNRGEIDVGKRLAVGTSYRVSRECEAGVFVARLLDATPSKRWVAQVGISYQVAGLVNRMLH